MIAVLTPCLFYAILVRVLNCVSKSACENCVRPPNTVFARDLADAIQRAHKDCKNKHAVDTAIILFAQCPLYLCYFLRNWTQCTDGFSLLWQRYVRKGTNDAKNPAILGFFQIERTVERTQLNSAHAQLVKKLRPIALAQTCRFLTIQSLEFQEIWQKIVHQPHEWSITKKIWILT